MCVKHIYNARILCNPPFLPLKKKMLKAVGQLVKEEECQVIDVCILYNIYIYYNYITFVPLSQSAEYRKESECEPFFYTHFFSHG